MTNIYEEAAAMVAEGSRFSVNFEKRSLRIDGKYVIEDGKYEGELGTPVLTLPETLAEIERLYDLYYHSVPSERSDSRSHCYFRALPEHELEDGDMLYGESRETAQLRLELYILSSVLNGSLYWDEPSMGKWFWQSAGNRDLVILKKWISNQQLLLTT